jgi:hypothetical protein
MRYAKDRYLLAPGRTRQHIGAMLESNLVADMKNERQIKGSRKTLPSLPSLPWSQRQRSGGPSCGYIRTFTSEETGGGRLGVLARMSCACGPHRLLAGEA